MSEVTTSPYDVLIGRELTDGWVVDRRASGAPDATGGNFSVCYHVRDSAGNTAFCKVLDFQAAVTSTDPIAALNQMTSDFTHEVGSLDACRGMRMRRVVLSLESATVPDAALPMGLLSYIIFEPAIGDLRMVLPLTFTADDLPLRFALLHGAAVGVAELHQARIAHQDLKPSNILAVGEAEELLPVGKVGDLGRAIVGDRPHRFDLLHFPGDYSYAPPEYRYGFVPSDEEERRRGTDLYQLGSLVAFALSGASLPALIWNELEPTLRWGAWKGAYEDIEPSVRDATERSIRLVVESVPDWCKEPIGRALQNLCDSDPSRRNGIVNGEVNVSRFTLARLISMLDRLRKRALIELRTQT